MEVFLMKAQTYQQLIVDREKERLAGFQKREAALRRDIMEAVKRFVKTSP
jgi:septum formation topological specificity factor MinE